MSSEKKFFVVLLAVAMLASIGCNRNKKNAAAPVATGYAVPASQPDVLAAAPAPVARRSSTYIK